MKGDVYRRIGVEPFINCCGTRTVHGGTLMKAPIRAAMMDAAEAFVNMDELMDGAGKRIAELSGAEAAIVTSGGSAALFAAAAGAVTGGDPERMLRLPRTSGMPDTVVMLKSGRFTYDQAIRAVGVSIAEVTTKQELESAIAMHDVGLVALLSVDRDPDRLPVAVVAEVAHRSGVPVLVDAASEPLLRPNPYLEAGADMVAYSGGKAMRGPQCTGLLIGNATWIRAAWLNAAPHHALGRTGKVGKEEIMGLLAAVEDWANGGAQESPPRWDRDLKEIADLVTSVETVEAQHMPSDSATSPVPKLLLSWDPERIPLHGLALRDALLAGRPRIMLDDRFSTDGSVFILPFSLQEGEAGVVGRRIAEVLRAAANAAPDRDTRVAPVDIAGEWAVTIHHPGRNAEHAFAIRQAGAALSGRHETQGLANDLTGSIAGDTVDLISEHRYEGTHLVYRFTGLVTTDRIAGEVELGTEGQSAPGPLNRREFGAAPWEATRRRPLRERGH